LTEWVLTKQVNSLNALVKLLGPKYRQEKLDVVKLFEDRKIHTYAQAKNTIVLLDSRGKENNIKALERLAHHRENANAAESHKVVRFNYKRPALQNYFVKGRVIMDSKYTRTRGGKSKQYEKLYEGEEETWNETIKAVSKKDAEEQYKQMATDYFNNNNHSKGQGSDDWRSSKVTDIFIDDVVPESSFKAKSEKDSMMKKAYPVKYDFIPSDDRHLKHEGEFVTDQTVGIYSEQWKNEEKLMKRNKMTPVYFSRKNFVEECENIEYQLFDKPDWCVADGVRTETLNRILKKHNVSYYSYDITNECFDKYVATTRHFKTLVYYSINNHMYWVGDKDKALSLIRSASAVETNIRTDMIDDYEQKNIYLDDNGQVKPIFENIPIQDLMQEQYNNSIIFYTTDLAKDGDTWVICDKDDLNTELK